MLAAGALLISLSVLAVLGEDPTVGDVLSILEPVAVTEASNSGPLFSQCGKLAISGRVIGGQRSAPGDHPWQASLQARLKGSDGEFRHICGGTLLSSCWVLTAAHCINTTLEYRVVLGGLNIDKHEVADQAIQVIQTIVHENYSRPTTTNDIALLHLSITEGPYCAKENPFVRAACLPDEAFPAETECVLSGWGRTENGTRSLHLLDAHIKLIPEEKCKTPEVYGDMIRTGMFCAGTLEGGIGSCFGDSGGPLVCERNGTQYITGAVSWGGRVCAGKNMPSVFTDVYHFKSWINSKISVQDE